MGLVSQEPVLFNDTIRANIGYGKNGGRCTTNRTKKIVDANDVNINPNIMIISNLLINIKD